MAKTRAQKEEVLNSLVEALKAEPQIAIFTAQSGITVSDTEEIRNAQKEKGSKVMMVKKTLLNKALSEQGMEASLNEANGLISIILNYEDAISPTKIIANFQKDNEGMEILGGIYEGKIVDADVIKQLSTLPTFEEAMAKFMFAMQAVGNKFAATIEALREKKEGEEGVPAEAPKTVEETPKEESKEEKATEEKTAPVEDTKAEAPVATEESPAEEIKKEETPAEETKKEAPIEEKAE